MHVPFPHALAGGWVRVEACNSTWINDRHPRESSGALSGKTRALLLGMGHSARQWGSAMSASGGEGSRWGSVTWKWGDKSPHLPLLRVQLLTSDEHVAYPSYLPLALSRTHHSQNIPSGMIRVE